jgi:pyridoxal 5'-phosphate synthase / NAD(P)H-hydrate epimerase
LVGVQTLTVLEQRMITRSAQLATFPRAAASALRPAARRAAAVACLTAVPARAPRCHIAMSSSPPASAPSTNFLGQKESQELDIDLMGDQFGFTLEQLMELAGLSVASAVERCYPPSQFRRVLVICGPGNNGGDGLVAARHLHHFGFSPVILYPKRSGREPFYGKLVTQCEQLSIPFLELPGADDSATWLRENYDLVVDAIFGFSFSGGPMRAPFDGIVSAMKACDLPIASVDIPSGWHVEDGNVSGDGLEPEMLISLSTPKQCAGKFGGKHHCTAHPCPLVYSSSANFFSPLTVTRPVAIG